MTSARKLAAPFLGPVLAPFLAPFLVMGLASGCAVGPDYSAPPEIDAGPGWSSATQAGPDSAELALWWTHFGDPTLDQLVTQAVTQNLELRQARERIAEARSLRDRARGGRAPQVDASASLTRRRQSENGALPVGAIPGLSTYQTIYEPGFDAAWELDLFGATRRSIESAEAGLQARVEEATDVRISVAAEVARTYLDLRGAQRELTAAQARVNIQQAQLQLIEERIRVGDLAKADREPARQALAEAQARLPALEARIRSGALSLGVLLGQLPESLLSRFDGEPPALTLAAIPVGERADLLRRRPDIRSAERRLAGSSADVGVARAELFPKLSISAAAGFEALSSGELFDAASREWSVAPLISWRVFDGGRVRAEIRATEARQREAALAYQQAVLEALGDAETALARYQAGLRQQGHTLDALEAANESHRHSTARLEAGDIERSQWLESESLVRGAEQALAEAQTESATRLVALFKALGGGWSQPESTQVAESPQ